MRLRIVVAIMAAALASVSPAASPTVKAGVDAWQRGDHQEATAIWRNLAEKGDADAAFNLGQAFRLGRGGPADSAQAKRWFEMAANKGHLDAQVSLGLLLFDSGDRAVAMSWLRKAAARGEPRALLVVGTALFNGDGMKQDPVLGYAYVSRAAAQGLAPAQSTLAEMDKIMTLEERKRGVAMAIDMAKSPASPETKMARKTPAPAAAAKPVASKTEAPPAKVAAAAKAQAAARGAWRVQLGAFSTKGAAEGLYKKLSGSAVLAGRQPYYVPAGKITRLQVGPFESRATASSACARLKPQPCFAVEAR